MASCVHLVHLHTVFFCKCVERLSIQYQLEHDSTDQRMHACIAKQNSLSHKMWSSAPANWYSIAMQMHAAMLAAHTMGHLHPAETVMNFKANCAHRAFHSRSAEAKRLSAQMDGAK